MRSVRCDVCGTKALMAASQCPKCSHLFEVRDGFGELLPLSFCSSCQSYYPAHIGSCKWCGTAPEPVRKPLPWTHITVGGLIAMAWLAGVLLRDPRGKSHAKSVAQLRARAQARRPAADDSVLQVVASAAPEDTVVKRDTVAKRDTIAAWTNIDAPAAAPTPAADPAAPDVPTAVAPDGIILQSGALAPRDAARQPSHQLARPIAQRSVAAIDPPDVASPLPAAPIVPQSKTRAGSRWVILVAKSWIVVRTGASKDSHIVASVGPESRVQLGETRGSWRRLRSRDIIGWVDLRRASFAEIRGSRRTNGLASR